MSTISIQDIVVREQSTATGEQKLQALRVLLRDLESVAVAYSGGVDSTFILKVAYDVLSEHAVAVTALSPSFPSDDLESAKKVAGQIGVRHVILETHEVEDARYLENSSARCYFCKTEMYTELGAFAHENSLQHVVDGLNEDDLTDRRPGRQAALEQCVRSPLAEVHLRKSEIRALSHEMSLPTWDKPAMACLSSRVPYGTRITRSALAQIDAAESFLRRLGVRQVRVRHHEAIARLEVEPEDLANVIENREAIAAELKSLGYTFVALDLECYRTGSLHALVGKPWIH
jgi:pyridinium-3,5-biscarboxylic acid mononucleotide sulfurtransferase